MVHQLLFKIVIAREIVGNLPGYVSGKAAGVVLL